MTEDARLGRLVDRVREYGAQCGLRSWILSDGVDCWLVQLAGAKEGGLRFAWVLVDETGNPHGRALDEFGWFSRKSGFHWAGCRVVRWETYRRHVRSIALLTGALPEWQDA